MIPQNLVNPFNVDSSLEFPHVPEAHDNWTEYHYFFGYDPKAGIGLSLHIGRLVADLSVWRGILYIYLPEGEVLARKFAGRGGETRGFGAGPLRIQCIEPMQLWTIAFDGAMSVTTRQALMREPVRDGVDELVKLHFLLDSAAPLFVLNHETMQGLDWSHFHAEQISRVRGEISFRGKTLTLRGVGARDHSSGPRNSSGALGGIWGNMLFPNGVAININLARTKKFTLRTGYVYWGDGTPLELVKAFTCPDVPGDETPRQSVPCDIMNDDASRQFVIEVQTTRGPQTINVSRVHAVASTYVPPHHELGGTDLTMPDAAQQTKSACLCTLNGEVGVGQFDGYRRIYMLK